MCRDGSPEEEFEKQFDKDCFSSFSVPEEHRTFLSQYDSTEKERTRTSDSLGTTLQLLQRKRLLYDKLKGKNLSVWKSLPATLSSRSLVLSVNSLESTKRNIENFHPSFYYI